MIEAGSKVDTAAQATEDIEYLVFQAAQLLREGLVGKIMVNSLGVYKNPPKRDELQNAMDILEKALAQTNAIAWPIERDYNVL